MTSHLHMLLSVMYFLILPLGGPTVTNFYSYTQCLHKQTRLLFAKKLNHIRESIIIIFSIICYYRVYKNAIKPTNMSDLDSPDSFLQRVVELEAEAILLGGSLNQLACTKQDSAHPVVRFGGLID